MSGTTLEPQKAKPSKKKIIAITAASVAAALVLGGAGFGLYRNHQVQALAAECKSAVATVKKSQQTLADLVKSDDVVKALKVTDKQVADKKTVATLKSAVEDADSKITFPNCTVQFFDFDKNPVKDVHAIGKTVTGRSTAISNAVEAVNKSVAAKQLQDAKDKLKKTIDNASKVLADSDGKVQDNAVRDSLKKVIDNAKKTLDDKKITDVKKFATKALDDAVNAVNASVKAKRQADEAAQNNTTQAPSTNTWSGGNNTWNNGGGATQNWGGAGQQTTQPTKPQGGTAPQGGSNPAQGGNSGSIQPSTGGGEWAEFPCEGPYCGEFYVWCSGSDCQ